MSRPRKYLTIEEFDEFVNNKVRHIERKLFFLDIKVWVILAFLGIILFVIGMTT